MNRRRLLALFGSAFGAALGGALPLAAQAHHGWSSFDPSRPLYLKGRVKQVRWRNPHAELEIELVSDLSLPAGLTTRQTPAQTSQFDGKAILENTRLPERRDEVWTVELAPLTRMKAWGVAPIEEGETVELIGYTLADKSEAVLRAEWLFRDGKAYGLRSSPA
jgi:hypothetical protein